MPHQQNAFGIFGKTTADSDDESMDTVAMQVAALTYQSQVTALMAATLLQRAEQQFAHLVSQQNLMHEIMHQIIMQVNALSFNQSDAGHGKLESFNSSGRRQGCSRRQWGGAQMAVDGGQFGGSFVPAASSHAHGSTAAVAPYQGRGPPLFHAPPENRQQGPAQYIPSSRGYGAGGHGNGHTPAALISNRVKLYANWNVCYSCGFDVPGGHTSMTCPTNLHKLLHDIYFTQQNAQQYIALGHP
jgi:hypothetical protein